MHANVLGTAVELISAPWSGGLENNYAYARSAACSAAISAAATCNRLPRSPDRRALQSGFRRGWARACGVEGGAVDRAGDLGEAIPAKGIAATSPI